MSRLFPALLLLCASMAAETHTVYPVKHSRVFTAQANPIARVRSGDTIVTRTWDSGGKDEKGVWHIQHPYTYPEHGNPLTGPFYVEDAEYGDMLEVHVDKLRLNRADGYSSFRVSQGVFSPGADLHDPNYGMDAVRKGTSTLLPWEIDAAAGTVTPKLRPQDSSGWKIELPARPMLGCIGVAPAYDEVRTSGPSGNYGGNMDYNDIVEGATVYLPVFAPGAHLFVGDAHARQGDGEGWGNGVETSTDVQMTVKLHKGKRLGNPRLVTPTHLVSVGSQPEFGSSMDFALRSSMTDMLNWLTNDCGLTGPEAHVLLGGVVEHKIITYYGSVATMIPKQYLPPRCHVFPVQGDAR
ncbi:MAG: acetamidase/formamidase family protein [Bryobacterales bacterium]